jgi:hypothetical protein
MEPQKQNVTQKAIHVAQGEGKLVWFADELLTFKVDRDQSESVGIFEDEVPPETGPPAHLHRSQDETHYILEGQFEFVVGERKRLMLVPARWSTFPGRRCTPSLTQEHRRASSCLSIHLQGRWSSSW